MRNERRGKLIVFEGIDGSGKSTQLERAFVWLTRRAYSVSRLREPTAESFYGQALRASALSGRLSPEDERDYFVQDRCWNVENNILPALTRGQAVLLDRYYFSSIAYQGALGLDQEDIRSRNEAIAPPPDMVILLDLAPQIALDRIQQQRRDVPNLYESLGYLTQVRNIFNSLRDPFIKRVDAGPAEEYVWQQIELLLAPIFPPLPA